MKAIEIDALDLQVGMVVGTTDAGAPITVTHVRDAAPGWLIANTDDYHTEVAVQVWDMVEVLV